MYRLCCQILGPPFGDFRPGAMSREEFLALVRLTAKPALPSTVRQVFAPRATFSNVVLEFGRQENVERWDDWFCRSSRSADGAVVTGANAAVVFFNGDCPLVCLWHNDRLAVTHAGYRCLIREDAEERNLLETALDSFEPRRVQAWIGFGIGPCCWIPGYDTKPEILDPSRHVEADTIRTCRSFTTDASPGGEGQGPLLRHR